MGSHPTRGTSWEYEPSGDVDRPARGEDLVIGNSAETLRPLFSAECKRDHHANDRGHADYKTDEHAELKTVVSFFFRRASHGKVRPRKIQET